MKRKLIKFSNYSFCITLPKKAIEQLGWHKGEEVEVEFDSKLRRILVMKDKKPIEKKPLDKDTPTKENDIQPIPKLRW